MTTDGAFEFFLLPMVSDSSADAGAGRKRLVHGGRTWAGSAGSRRRRTRRPRARRPRSRRGRQRSQARSMVDHSRPTWSIEYGPTGARRRTARPLHLAAERCGSVDHDPPQPPDSEHHIPVPGRGDEPDRIDIRRVRRIHHRPATEMSDQEGQAREKRNTDRPAHLLRDQLNHRRGPVRRRRRNPQRSPGPRSSAEATPRS